MFDRMMTSSKQRVKFPKEVKRELLRSQGGRCMSCGGRQRLDLMDIDYKVPFSRGGSNDRDNLQLLCRTCNTPKGSKTDKEFRRMYWETGLSQGETPPVRTIRQSDFVAVGRRSTRSCNKHQRTNRPRSPLDELFRLYLG